MKIHCITLRQLLWCLVCVVLFLIIFLFLASLLFPFEKAQDVMVPITSQAKLQEILASEQKIAYLTFDDGPTKKMTPNILDILQEEGVPATFFMVGKHVKEFPELVKRAYEEGHYLANHTYSHQTSILYQSKEHFLEEVQKTDAAIAEALGLEEYHSYLFRFPEGFMSARQQAKKKEALTVLEGLGYSYVDWNCLNQDSERKYSAEQLMQNLIKTAKNKNTLIILMHDTGDVNPTDQVLRESIRYFKEQGYEFRNFYDIVTDSSKSCFMSSGNSANTSTLCFEMAWVHSKR